eukprot:7535531-Ditylum_brightwellii.AAC.1
MDDVTMDIHPEYQMISPDTNKLLSERGEIRQMSCAPGATMVAQESILIDHQNFSDNKSVTPTHSVHNMDDAM